MTLCGKQGSNAAEQLYSAEQFELNLNINLY